MPCVSVVVSGFGSFHNVASNPTERLAAWLRQQFGCGEDGGDASQTGSLSPHAIGGNPTPALQQSPVAPQPAPRTLRHGRVASCTTLKASARAVNSFLTRQLEELKRVSAAGCPTGGACAADSCACAAEPRVVLLLHFGADVHRPWFNLETRAINNATFRFPDEDGWRPDCCPIAALPGVPLDCPALTDLDLPRLHRCLRGRGHDVQISSEPGRFVCNWTYFNSLALCHEAMVVSEQMRQRPRQQQPWPLPAAVQQQLQQRRRRSRRGGAAVGSSSSGSNSDSGDAAAAAAAAAASADGLPHRGSSTEANGAAPAAAAVAPTSGPCRGPALAVHSLFVHVPSFESISEPRQQRFAIDLIDALCEQLHQRYAPQSIGPPAAASAVTPSGQRQQQQQQQPPIHHHHSRHHRHHGRHGGSGGGRQGASSSGSSGGGGVGGGTAIAGGACSPGVPCFPEPQTLYRANSAAAAAAAAAAALSAFSQQLAAAAAAAAAPQQAVRLAAPHLPQPQLLPAPPLIPVVTPVCGPALVVPHTGVVALPAPAVSPLALHHPALHLPAPQPSQQQQGSVMSMARHQVLA